MNKQKADAIITEYFSKIYGFAIKKSFSYDEAEDLCADIVKEVYLSLLKADEIVNVEGYVWRISEHTYSKYVASKKKQLGVSIDGMDISVDDEYFFEDSEEEILRLRREIAFLTARRREIVYSFYYENKTIASISAETGMPEGTVKWHLSKARNELKEGFSMERRIGELGMKPIKINWIGHDGTPGQKGGPEYYLDDKINFNIVYSVYFEPKTKEEIAQELGMTLVFIEDKIELLESNGFLVRVPGDKYTTYVKFNPRTYSREQEDMKYKKKQEVAKLLAEEYVPLVRKATADIKDVYIPSGNYELLEAAAVLYSILNKCNIDIKRDVEKYRIKTTDGGSYYAFVNIVTEVSDKDYVAMFDTDKYWICGNMNRWSEKYQGVYSWSADSRYCSRKGGWENNLTSDYEWLYEFITGEITDNKVSQEKFERLRKRGFLTKDNKVNIMIVNGSHEDFFAKIPELSEDIKKRFADYALEAAMLEAKDYPPQMQDYIIDRSTRYFVDNVVGIMVKDILYGNGTFKALTKAEKVMSDLIMFSDVLPE